MKWVKDVSVTEAVACRSSSKKVFLKISQILQENTCDGAGLQACNFIKTDSNAGVFLTKICDWRRSCVFIVTFEQTSYFVLVFPLLTLNKKMLVGFLLSNELRFLLRYKFQKVNKQITKSKQFYNSELYRSLKV